METTTQASEILTGTLWIDTDNGLGSNSGDIDDGFALYLACELQLERVSASYGNTSSKLSYNNTQLLKESMRAPFRVYEGASEPGSPNLSIAEGSATDLSEVTYLAMGPLTELCGLLKPGQKTFKKIVALGGRPESKGFLYPFWPHEFNFAKDPAATQALFQSKEDIYIVGLEQAEKLQYFLRDWWHLRNKPFPLKKMSRRWMIRNLILKLKPKLILWDVVAVSTLLWPELFTWETTKIVCDQKGRLRRSQEGLKIQNLKSLDLEELKKRTKNHFCES